MRMHLKPPYTHFYSISACNDKHCHNAALDSFKFRLNVMSSEPRVENKKERKEERLRKRKEKRKKEGKGKG